MSDFDWDEIIYEQDLNAIRAGKILSPGKMKTAARRYHVFPPAIKDGGQAKDAVDTFPTPWTEKQKSDYLAGARWYLNQKKAEEDEWIAAVAGKR